MYVTSDGKKTAKQLDIAYSMVNPQFRYIRGECINMSQRGSSKPFGMHASCVFFYLSESRAIFHAAIWSACIRYEGLFVVYYTGMGQLASVRSAGDLQLLFGMKNPVYSDACMNPALVGQGPYRAILEHACRTMVNAPLARARYPLRERKRVKRV